MKTGRDMAAVPAIPRPSVIPRTSVIPAQAGIHPSRCQAALGLALI
jgi:hypothetical protein